MINAETEGHKNWKN